MKRHHNLLTVHKNCPSIAPQKAHPKPPYYTTDEACTLDLFSVGGLRSANETLKKPLLVPLSREQKLFQVKQASQEDAGFPPSGKNVENQGTNNFFWKIRGLYNFLQESRGKSGNFDFVVSRFINDLHMFIDPGQDRIELGKKIGLAALGSFPKITGRGTVQPE